MGKAIGIDLGTTNSVVAALEAGETWVIPSNDDELIMPSCVGISTTGELLIGKTALRQFAAAPERTIKSIKRQMGTDYSRTLGERAYSPQEISALILKSLKEQAAAALGEEVTQAVITVPAYFTDAQRQATKEAGEIAGLEVLQILNEPTAAALTYEQDSQATELVLVYDLGGGTFDVSIVEITGAVTEVLASHGNNHLGGDDFDRRIQRYFREQFQNRHQVELSAEPSIAARLLRAAESAKIALSEEMVTVVREPFLASSGNKALHLELEFKREQLEGLIAPMLSETTAAIDRALTDANLEAKDLDRVILVGGSTRMPLVRRLVAEHLGQEPLDNVEPDLCVAMGAALQAGVWAGESSETILVDVIPHSLGIAAVAATSMGWREGMFSTIVPRNTVIPVSRQEKYSTVSDNQKIVKIEVFQGENPIAKENVPLGEFEIENLPSRPAGEVKIEVNFDFDLNGILTVTATELSQGQKEALIVNDATTRRLTQDGLNRSQQDIESLFNQQGTTTRDLDQLIDSAKIELERLDKATSEPLREAISQAEAALTAKDSAQIDLMVSRLEELLVAIG